MLNSDQLQQKTVTVVSQSQLASKLGLKPHHPTSSTQVSGFNEASAVFNAEEQKIAQITYETGESGVLKRHLRIRDVPANAKVNA